MLLAGLHGDDPHDVHDLLPVALEDCGVHLPGSDTAAANVAFDQVARLFATVLRPVLGAPAGQ